MQYPYWLVMCVVIAGALAVWPGGSDADAVSEKDSVTRGDTAVNSPPPPTGNHAIRGEIVLARADHDWMSQQIEEPCILPNPKVPGRLIMFY